MIEELSSTNINDIINEDDTEINDDIVDKILNELENPEVNEKINENIDFVDNNDFNNNHLSNNDEFRSNNSFRNNDDFNNNFNNNFNDEFRKEDFNLESKNDNESESTINKINTILNLDTDYNFSIINFIFDLKKTLIVFIIILLFNNTFIVDFLFNLISKLISSKFINDNISLIIRAVLSAVMFYLTEKFI